MSIASNVGCDDEKMTFLLRVTLGDPSIHEGMPSVQVTAGERTPVLLQGGVMYRVASGSPPARDNTSGNSDDSAVGTSLVSQHSTGDSLGDRSTQGLEYLRRVCF